MMFEQHKGRLMIGSAIVIAVIALWPASDHDVPEKESTNLHAPVVFEENEIDKIKIRHDIKKPTSQPPEPLPSLTVEKGMQHEMQRVADIYEQRSQYAPYSLYLSSSQTDLIHPNQSHESPRAYDINGENVSILIKPLQYRFSTGQKIEVEVQIKASAEGLKTITSLSLDIVATRSKEKWPMSVISNIEQQGMRTIMAEFDTNSALASFNEEHYAIAAQARFNNEAPVLQSAPIKIINSIASIVGLGTSRIDNNDLIIPINIEADKSGYYQVSASLFDQASNSAISFLIAKERLSSGSNTLDAKVQGLVLRDKGFSGPFRLQGITLVKKSERPGMPEEYGTADESYAVGAIDLNDFESIPYEDPMTEQRLEFMRSIGQ